MSRRELLVSHVYQCYFHQLFQKVPEIIWDGDDGKSVREFYTKVCDVLSGKKAISDICTKTYPNLLAKHTEFKALLEGSRALSDDAWGMLLDGLIEKLKEIISDDATAAKAANKKMQQKHQQEITNQFFRRGIALFSRELADLEGRLKEMKRRPVSKYGFFQCSDDKKIGKEIVDQLLNFLKKNEVVVFSKQQAELLQRNSSLRDEALRILGKGCYASAIRAGSFLLECPSKPVYACPGSLQAPKK